MKFKNWLEHNEIIMPKLFDRIRSINNKYVGAHFTKSNEISYNLMPYHHDPIGVYAFPRDYILSGGLERNSGFLQNNNIFILVPSTNAKILDLDMTESKAKELLVKMGISSDLMDDESISHNSSGKTIGHKFWAVLEHTRHSKGLSKNMSWNTLFSKTAYNVLYDNGHGIIHYNEPSQIVYLDHKTYNIVDVIKKESNNLILKIHSYFPDFKIKQIRSNRHDKNFIFLLVKNDDEKYGPIEIKISTDENYRNQIHVKLYGFDIKDNYGIKEFEFKINNESDVTSCVETLKEFMNKTPREENKNVDDEDEYRLIYDISNLYKLKMHKKYPGFISKKYKEETRFSIRYNPSSKLFSFEIIKNYGQGWVKYFYYHNMKAVDGAENNIKLSIQGIKEEIKKDINGEDISRKYNAEYALRFVEFLENRVFKPRSK